MVIRCALSAMTALKRPYKNRTRSTIGDAPAPQHLSLLSANQAAACCDHALLLVEGSNRPHALWMAAPLMDDLCLQSPLPIERRRGRRARAMPTAVVSCSTDTLRLSPGIVHNRTLHNSDRRRHAEMLLTMLHTCCTGT